MQNDIEAIWFPYHGPKGFYKKKERKKSYPFRPKEIKRL
jgi:hypothetical protein